MRRAGLHANCRLLKCQAAYGPLPFYTWIPERVRRSVGCFSTISCWLTRRSACMTVPSWRPTASAASRSSRSASTTVSRSERASRSSRRRVPRTRPSRTFAGSALPDLVLVWDVASRGVRGARGHCRSPGCLSSPGHRLNARRGLLVYRVRAGPGCCGFAEKSSGR